MIDLEKIIIDSIGGDSSCDYKGTASAIRREVLAELGGVLAQGYCTPRNSHKIVDPELIEDMVTAVRRMFEDGKGAAGVLNLAVLGMGK